MFTVGVEVQLEPAPVTVTVPCEPTNLPILVSSPARILMNRPPFAIVSVPMPELPTLSPVGPLIQLEPGPVTVTVPTRPR